MTHANVVLILILAGLVTLLIIVVGAMVWLDAKINSMMSMLDTEFVKKVGLEEKLSNLPMAQERGIQLNKVRKSVKKLHKYIVPRLLENSLIVVEIADKAGVSQDKIDEIKTAVRNGEIMDGEG